MKIVIATTSSYPDGMASTYRIHCYARALLKEKVHVQVVSVLPKNYRSGAAKWKLEESYEGVPYTIIWNSNKFNIKVLNYFRAEFQSYLLLWYLLWNTSQFSVLWLYGMGTLPRLILLPIMNMLGKKVVLELNEYPYATEGSRLTRIAMVKHTLQWITLEFVFPRFHGIICISEALIKVVKQNAPKVKILKVPILISKEAPKEKPHPEIQKLLSKNSKYIFHAGSLSNQKDGIIDVFRAYVKAASKIRSEGNELYFVLSNNRTHTHIWSQIEEILKSNGLEENIVVTGYLNEQELSYCLAHSSCLIINKPNSFQNRYNFPTKLGDYLLSGRPVVIAASGLEVNEFVNHKQNALVVSSNNIDQMCNAITELINDRAFANQIGQNGIRTAVKNFHFRTHSKRILHFLNSL